MKSACQMVALLAAAATSPSLAGETLLSENFASYEGTSATAPAGWYFSYHGHYTSAASSGPSGPNAYKFGEDQATVITPAFAAGADSASFWIRGNSTDSASRLVVLWTADSLQWDTVAVVTNLPTSATVFAFPLATAARRLKFIYEKSKGNVAFDDLAVTGSGTTGLTAGRGDAAPVVYPNPAAGGQLVRIVLPLVPEGPLHVDLFDLAGRQVLEGAFAVGGETIMNIGNLTPGVYIIRLEAGEQSQSRKLVVR